LHACFIIAVSPSGNIAKRLPETSAASPTWVEQQFRHIGVIENLAKMNAKRAREICHGFASKCVFSFFSLPLIAFSFLF